MTDQLTDDLASEHRLPPAAPDSAIYRVHGLSQHIAMAAIHGERDGLLKPGDIPPIEGDADRRKAHKVIVESGALAAYQEEMVKTVFVATCPWWCDGSHDIYAGSIGDILHTRRVLANYLPGDDAESLPLTAELQAYEAPDVGVSAPSILVQLGGVPVVDSVSAATARAVAAALIAAADVLEGIVTADETSLTRPVDVVTFQCSR